MVFRKAVENSSSWMYLIFRLIVGFFFAMHGAQKLGLTGGSGMAGFMMFLGVCELLIGLGIFFGVLTRIAATAGIIIMIGAILTVHNTLVGKMPFMSGEIPWLFLGAFLILIMHGPGMWSLERATLKNELMW
jgi:putative oxidoreductase